MSDAVTHRAEAEALLLREARLLDERRFDEWIALFTDDCRYWLPMGDEPDPARRVSLLYDDRLRMRLRIDRLQGKYAFSQEPPSRTCRTLTGLEFVDPGAREPGVDLVVLGVSTIFTVRREPAESVVGRCRYHLRWVEEVGGWRIALKRVDLLTRDRAIHNLSFVV